MTDQETKRAQWRAASQRRRDRLKAAGDRAPSGPSGGDATAAERQRRHRAKVKAERERTPPA